jgi:hypothetical protein
LLAYQLLALPRSAGVSDFSITPRTAACFANSALSGFVVLVGIFVKHSVVLKLHAFAAFSFDFLGVFLSIFCGLVFFFFFFFFFFSFSSQFCSG